MIHKATDSLKFRRLVRRLRPIATNPLVTVETIAVGLLERLWHATIRSAYRGDIGKFDDEEIAEFLGWIGDAEQLVTILVESGWLDESPTHRLIVHDWHEHAPNHIKGNGSKAGWAYLDDLKAKAEPEKEVLGDAPRGPALEAQPQEDPPSRGRASTLHNHTQHNITIPAWEDARRLMADVELGGIGKAIKAAKAIGSTPEHIVDLIAEWKTRKTLAGWKNPEGVLYSLICESSPTIKPVWPDTDSLKSQRAHRRAMEPRPSPAPEPNRGPDNEALFGSVLDQMSEADQARLIEQIAERLGASTAAAIRKNRTGAMARSAMLLELSRTMAPPATK